MGLPLDPNESSKAGKQVNKAHPLDYSYIVELNTLVPRES